MSRHFTRNAWARHFATLRRFNYSRFRNHEAGNTKSWGSIRDNRRLDVQLRNLDGRRVPAYSIASDRTTGDYITAHEYVPHSFYPHVVQLLEDEPNGFGRYEPTRFLELFHSYIMEDITNDELAEYVASLGIPYNIWVIWAAKVDETIADENSWIGQLTRNDITIGHAIKLAWTGSLATIRAAGF